MAYQASIDYQARKNELKKQIDTETDATKKAALQSQYDAAEQSRLEKMASDLGTYGKYATGGELNQAAGILAENQLGTDYEAQKKQLQDYYTQAKQSASNEALSRGMGRSSYVQDRLSNLDVQQASGLSDIDIAKAKALQSARASILSDYQTNAATAAANKQSDARSQIGTILNAGGTPSSALWTASGYDPSTVYALQSALAAQKASYTPSATPTTPTTQTTTTGNIPSQLTPAISVGVKQEIDAFKAQGYTSSQIKRLALNAYNSGDMSWTEYQMYAQNAGS